MAPWAAAPTAFWVAMKRCRQRPWCLDFAELRWERAQNYLTDCSPPSMSPQLNSSFQRCVNILFFKLYTFETLPHTPNSLFPQNPQCRWITATGRRWWPPPTPPQQSAAPAAPRPRQGPCCAAECCCVSACPRGFSPSPCAPPPARPCSGAWRRS